MNILAIDQSTETTSIALKLVVDGWAVGSDASCGSKGIDVPLPTNHQLPTMVRDLLAEQKLTFGDLDRIVVGMGPGSFAGIRGALSFAQGVVLGRDRQCRLYGVSSAAAVVRDGETAMVVGDARRGLFWMSIHQGLRTVSAPRLVQKEELADSVGIQGLARKLGCGTLPLVVTPDGARIGGVLEEIFGERFAGNRRPSAERLIEIALGAPEELTPEPLPIYLSPAVRN